MRDLICDVVNCCVWSCDAYDNTVIEKLKKKTTTDEHKIFLQEFPSRRRFPSEIHSKQIRNDERSSAVACYSEPPFNVYTDLLSRHATQSNTMPLSIVIGGQMQEKASNSNDLLSQKLSFAFCLICLEHMHINSQLLGG